MQSTTRGWVGIMFGAALLLGGCSPADRSGDREAVDPQAPAGTTDSDRAAARAENQQAHEMRIEVDIAARELHVYRGGERAETHPVAVGSAEWPTRTGEWSVDSVVWNPRWVPPEEEWAEDQETREPGDPDNPLGRAQLIYDAPRSIHGTNQPESIGQAVSHGSIRVSNDVAVQLARQAMEAGGETRDESWFRRVQEDRSTLETVRLSNPIPIRVFRDG